MKRILSIILAALMLSALPAVAEAPLSVSITNPADGSVIGNDERNVTIETTGDVADTIFELDGTLYNQDTFTLGEDMLTLGEHTLKVYVLDSIGNSATAKSTFTVEKSITAVRVNQDFEGDFSSLDLTGSPKFGDGIENDVDTGGVQAARQPKQTWAGVVKAVEGPDGDGDVAYDMTSSEGTTNTRPQFQITTTDSIETVATMKFDMKVNAGTNVKFGIYVPQVETPTKNDTIFPKDEYIFNSAAEGTILGTDNAYEKGKWYHVEVVADNFNKTVNLTVSHKDSDGQMVTRNILTNASVPALGRPINGFVLDYRGSAGMGYSIDNIYLAETPTLKGIDKITYMYGDEESTDEYASAEDTTALKIYMKNAVVAEDISFVSIKDKNGNSIVPTAATTDSVDNALIVSLPDNALSENAQYDVKVALSAIYGGDISGSAWKSFATATGAFSVDAELKAGSAPLFTVQQLYGKTLSGSLLFKNAESESKSLVAVVTVRSGKALAGISIVPVTVPANANDYSVPFETGLLPTDMENVKIQVMLLESLQSRKIVFGTIEKMY